MSGALSKFLFSYDTLTRAVAGSTGSVIAMSVFYPLDVVRSRLQVDDQEPKNAWKLMKDIMQEEGLITLYKGIGPVLQSLWVSNFIFFYVFHGLKYKLNHEQKTMAKDLLYASVAGVVNVLTTTPLWVVTTRMKTDTNGSKPNRRYKNLVDGLIKIKNKEGVGALWSSTLPSLLLVANPAIHMMLYEFIKRKLEGPNRVLGSKSYFLIAAFCKTVTSILTYPLQVVQTKARHGHNYKDLRRNAGMMELIAYIIRKQGVLGLFRGVETKIVQTALTVALMYTAYEKIAALVFGVMKPNQKLMK